MNQIFLKENQLALLKADSATGIVLTIDNKQRQSDSEQMYIVFESMEDVDKYVEMLNAADDTIECCVFNYKYELVKFFQAPKWKMKC
jgi:hypothetical protein